MTQSLGLLTILAIANVASAGQSATCQLLAQSAQASCDGMKAVVANADATQMKGAVDGVKMTRDSFAGQCTDETSVKQLEAIDECLSALSKSTDAAGDEAEARRAKAAPLVEKIKKDAKFLALYKAYDEAFIAARKKRRIYDADRKDFNDSLTAEYKAEWDAAKKEAEPQWKALTDYIVSYGIDVRDIGHFKLHEGG